MQQHNKKWITFIYYGPAVRKVTNLFKRTNVKIAYCPTNTIYQQLSQKPNNTNPSGKYQLKLNMCKKAYVGQWGRSITIRYKEHLRYIRCNNTTSAYYKHILNYRNNFGPTKLNHARKAREWIVGRLYSYIYITGTTYWFPSSRSLTPIHSSTWLTYHVTNNISLNSVPVSTLKRMPVQQGKSILKFQYFIPLISI